MKYFLTSLLVFSFAFHLGGGLALFKLEQYALHVAMDSALSSLEHSASLHTFTFSLDEFSARQTRENELKFEGKMYDVVKSSIQNDSITISCVRDTDEEHLIAEFVKYFSTNNPHSREQQQSLPAQFVKLLLISFLKVENFSLLKESFSATVSFDRVEYFSSPVLPFDPPPPKI